MANGREDGDRGIQKLGEASRNARPVGQGAGSSTSKSSRLRERREMMMGSPRRWKA